MCAVKSQLRVSCRRPRTRPTSYSRNSTTQRHRLHPLHHVRRRRNTPRCGRAHLRRQEGPVLYVSHELSPHTCPTLCSDALALTRPPLSPRTCSTPLRTLSPFSSLIHWPRLTMRFLCVPQMACTRAVWPARLPSSPAPRPASASTPRTTWRRR